MPTFNCYTSVEGTSNVKPSNGSENSPLVALLIRQEKNGGAWCPKAQISSDVKEYLEVDLQKNHLMTWTETQGRFGNGQGQEYAEAFLVEYWRHSLGQWITYKDSRGEKVLTGNSNTYLVVRQRLELPFIASRVRFIPYSEHPRTVCMRVELYGCPWERDETGIFALRGRRLNGVRNRERVNATRAVPWRTIRLIETYAERAAEARPPVIKESRDLQEENN
ncbi:hypothetical protein GWI33_014235 [Rhynchophorus ferrugineus]|uniref:F5/8 type C domain-containing protein n=1 Tax=Rhynchophorus ferrugineus TaxID=354439 RepID=A0A834I1U8_RHYFE|nr:hypothetical protein GWI33_014235 [Rhynchophorus ferrugineus]